MKTSLFPKVSDILDEKNHLIKITRPITPDFADICVEAIHKLAQRSKVIDVYVNCEGIYATEAARIMLALWSYNKKDYWVIGYVDKAIGAPFLILQGCQVSIGFSQSQVYLNRFQIDLKLYKKMTKKDLASEKSVFEFLAYRTNNSLQKIYEIAGKAQILTAAEAVKQNLLSFIQSKRPSHLP